MKARKIFFILTIIALFITTSKAQLNFDFNTADDVAKWPGYQCNSTWLDNKYIQLDITGAFWAVATYEPVGGINWDCDNNKVIVVKVQKQSGDFSLKGYSNIYYKDYEFKDTQPFDLPNSTFKLHVLSLEDYASTYPEIQTGIFPFQKMYFTMIYVNPGDKIQIDWVKTYSSKSAAQAYIQSIFTPAISFTTQNSVNKTYGDAAFTNAANSNSAGAISYSSGTTSVATVNSTTGEVTIVGAGQSIITASQVANGDFNAGSQTYTLNVDKATQSINFGPLSSKIIVETDYSPGATSASSSVNPITYTSSNTSVATIIANQIHLVGIGSTNITASQAASTNYNAASIEQSLVVNPQPSQLNFDFNTADDVAKWPGYQCNTTWLDNKYIQLDITGAFWAVATYEPVGGINWDCDNNKVIVVKVQKQSGDFSLKGYSNIYSKDYEFKDTQPFDLPNSTFKLHVLSLEDYASTYPEIQTGIFPFQKMYFTMVYVNPGDKIQVDWVKTFPTKSAAQAYIQSIFTPAITFATPTTINKTVGESPFTNIATSNSTGTITYSSGTTSVATVNSTTGEVTIVGAGSSIITALQIADGNYNAASQTYTLNVAARPVLIMGSVATAADLTNPVADISVPANTELTIGATSTAHSITIERGGKVTLNDNVTLNVSNININSDVNGTGTFVDKSTNGLVVTGTVQQYLGTARNWYMAPPVAGASVPTGQTYYSYLEAGSNTGFVAPASLYWKAEAQGSPLDPRKGYIVQAAGESTLSFTGTLNTGSQTPLTLTRTTGKTNEGFNLVANPYPSYLDWKLVSAANTGLLTTAWFRTKNNSGGYIFATVNVANPLSPVIVAVNPNTTITTLIPPMQAYWVRVNAVGSTTYTVNNTMRAHVDNTGNKFKAPAQITQPMIRLRVSNGSNADETVVLFNDNATNGIDMFDSPKMFNNTASVPEIYTQAGTEKLVINGINELKYNTEIPIGFSTLTAGDFNISTNELSNFEAGTKVILLDKQNPTVETELTNETAYHFSAPITAANAGRFSLLFRAPTASTGIDKTVKGIAQVFVNAANQITIIAPEKCNYAIYNAVGQLIENGVTNYKLHTVNYKLNTGVYVVKVNNQSTRVIVK